ncbi:MAG TPA: hypothetical protein VGP93_01000, partial [Polyangiaceae bacterium]|nr:hypothetical protein [Polyangiaceae bacterium]
MERALFAVWPRLATALPWLELGELPTPVQAISALARELGASAELYVKRDDQSSSLYGGNKVRTLE